MDPQTGLLLRIIDIPATYVTSCTFGGPDMDILYVTTSKLRVKSFLNEPLAGNVFAVRGLGVKGLPADEFVRELPPCLCDDKCRVCKKKLAKMDDETTYKLP